MTKVIKVEMTLRVSARIPFDDEASLEKLRVLQECVLPALGKRPPWLLIGAVREEDKLELFSNTGGRIESINVAFPEEKEKKDFKRK